MTTYSWQLQTPIDAIIFDCDGTLSAIEGIDELARERGVGASVEQLTANAMTAQGMHPDLFQARLDLVKPSKDQVTALAQRYLEQLAPDARTIIQLFTRLKKSIYIISAGLQPAVVAFGEQLGIPAQHILAVKLYFDPMGNYQDFDHTSPMVHQQGKREVVAELKKKHGAILYIGDGITDYETHDEVTRFIGYGGVYYRENIENLCDFYLKCTSMAPLLPLTLTEDEVLNLTTPDMALYQKGLMAIKDNQVTIHQHAARMQTLKSVAPFADLSTERLHQLAEKMTEIHLPKDSIIFHQGDEGHCCYLVESGTIDISITTPNGIKSLATLEKNDIFGEVALLLETERNATARTLTDTTLLVIDKSILFEVLQTDAATAESLLMLQQSRTRPIKDDAIEVHQLTLKNPHNNKYFRLTEHGLFIWNQLDGEHSLSDITLSFYQQYHIFNPGVISSLMIELQQSGFIELKQATQFLPAQKLPRLTRGLLWLREIMRIKYVFTAVDTWLAHTYQRYLWPVYTKLGLSLLFCLALSGLVLFALQTPHASNLLNQSSHKLASISIVCLLSIITVGLHELAHAYTTKAFGKQVHAFGIGWFWTGPIAFCDTSDMWLAPKRERIAVDLAGIYLNLCMAGLAGWCLYFSSGADWKIIFWLYGLMNYMSVMINLNPATELDGYYTLMDLFDKPNLRASALEWLTSKTPRYSIEAGYWVIVLSYLLVVEIVIPFIIAKYLLHGLFNIQNAYINFMVVLFITSISGVSFWVELKTRFSAKKSTELKV